jgi:hypothetical protein
MLNYQEIIDQIKNLEKLYEERRKSDNGTKGKCIDCKNPLYEYQDKYPDIFEREILSKNRPCAGEGCENSVTFCSRCFKFYKHHWFGVYTRQLDNSGNPLKMPLLYCECCAEENFRISFFDNFKKLITQIHKIYKNITVKRSNGTYENDWWICDDGFRPYKINSQEEYRLYVKVSNGKIEKLYPLIDAIVDTENYIMTCSNVVYTTKIKVMRRIKLPQLSHAQIAQIRLQNLIQNLIQNNKMKIDAKDTTKIDANDTTKIDANNTTKINLDV